MEELQLPSSMLLGSVFVGAGAIKLFHLTRFRDTLSAMEVFPRSLTGGVSRAMPPLEIGLGICVFLGWRSSVSVVLLLAFLASFLFVLTFYRLRGGKEIVCGCFSDFDHKTTTSSIILRNIMLLASGVPLLIPTYQPIVNRGLAEWLLAITTLLGVLLGWSLLSRLVGTVGQIRLGSRIDDG